MKFKKGMIENENQIPEKQYKNYWKIHMKIKLNLLYKTDFIWKHNWFHSCIYWYIQSKLRYIYAKNIPSQMNSFMVKTCEWKFHMKSKYFSYEKLTISETFQNRHTTQYQFFHFIWWEKIFWLNFSHEKPKKHNENK